MMLLVPAKGFWGGVWIGQTHSRRVEGCKFASETLWQCVHVDAKAFIGAAKDEWAVAKESELGAAIELIQGW